jgi:CheY-like chemotaxis protein
MTDATPAGSVLVVDDDRDLRELVADVVEGSGRRVFTARDGTDALQRIEGADLPRPCIVLLDWLMHPTVDGRSWIVSRRAPMPGRSGSSSCRRAAPRRPRCCPAPCSACSASRSVDELQAALEHG